MIAMQKTQRAKWTPEQIAELRRLAKSGCTVKQAAQILGYTYYQVIHEATRREIGFNPTGIRRDCNQLDLRGVPERIEIMRTLRRELSESGWPLPLRDEHLDEFDRRCNRQKVG